MEDVSEVKDPKSPQQRPPRANSGSDESTVPRSPTTAQRNAANRSTAQRFDARTSSKDSSISSVEESMVSAVNRFKLRTADDNNNNLALRQKPNEIQTPFQAGFTCEQCKKTFTRLSDLQRHDRMHKSKFIDCPHIGCSRVGSFGFSRKDKFMDHLRHCHHREAPRSDYALENPALSSLLDSESSNSGKSLVDLHTATKRRRLGSPVESEQRQSKDSTIQRFACPYFKREPERYRTWRTCAGPGWNSISRLKEHLYRRHTLPIHCDQCWETFRSEEALAQHRTKPDPCQPRRRGSNSLDGFDGEQALKLRQRSTRDWRDVYRVLFPDAPSDEVPSPHYEHETEQTWQRPTSPLSSQFRRYEQFLSRELPSLVQQRVEAAIDPASSPVEDVVRTQLGDIVRRSQRELSTEFSLQESRTTEHQDIYPVTNGGLLSEFVVGEDGLPGLTPGSYSSFDHTGDLFLNSDAHLNEDYGFWYQETYPQLLDVDSDLQLA